MGSSGRFTHVMLYWTVWDRFIQVLYLGRAPRIKETLLDFLKWCRVSRHPLVFPGLTGSQRTTGFGASQDLFIPDHQVYETNNSGSIPEFSIGQSIFRFLWFCLPN